jgi:hypothetical protein
VTEYRQVSEAEAEKLRETAQLVMSTLIHFGFRATTPLENAGLGGAEVEVDTGDDAGGGVHVHWAVPHSLNNEAISHIMGGDQDHPSVRQSKSIRDLMFQVIMTVLIADGFDVRPSDDGMNAGFIDILSTPTKH